MINRFLSSPPQPVVLEVVNFNESGQRQKLYQFREGGVRKHSHRNEVVAAFILKTAEELGEKIQKNSGPGIETGTSNPPSPKCSLYLANNTMYVLYNYLYINIVWVSLPGGPGASRTYIVAVT